MNGLKTKEINELEELEERLRIDTIKKRFSGNQKSLKKEIKIREIAKQK